MKPLHNIQREIIAKMLFNTGLSYSQMKPSGEMENNKFDFHLKRLIRMGFIIKGKKNYILTTRAKEYANRFDTEKKDLEKQATLTVWMCCVNTKPTIPQYLIYTRLKQPWYGCQGFPTGKLQYGETVIEGTRRELKEETNLDGDPELVSIRHYIVKNKNTEDIIEDKFMFFCKIENPKGKLLQSNEGRYEWVNRDALFTIVKKPFENKKSFKRDILEIESFSGITSFTEIPHETNKF